MNETPERIWAFAPDIFDNLSVWQDAPSPAGDTTEYVRIDVVENLEAKLSKALTALGDVQRFVKDLEPYANQGHTLVPALQKACAVYVELKGETNV